ncbi:DNA-binding protein [Dysgonomonas sp. 216]|uniref:helix-turn-helix domain-containing protein n=1 Tax=Dysgonomonas sp. 216 TaxID=2302934 RepID=UPI0013D4FDCD|nr:helix-turn-helix domain-containing protein [Dysgonomonas sp. 216]NDW18733.1 DNA-binding protein [Dysgonomonas sp. 216]
MPFLSELCLSEITIKHPVMEEDTDNSMEHLHRKLDEILRLIKAKNRLNGEHLYDNQDLCIMLKLSKRSLQRLRSFGILPYLQIGQKTFYLESDVMKYIQDQIDNKKTLGDDDKEQL